MFLLRSKILILYQVVTGGALNIKINFQANQNHWRWAQIFSPLQVPETAWEPPRLNINDLYGKAILLSDKLKTN